MTGSHSFKRIKIFLAVVIFAFLSILLWNVCFNRHSMTGVVIENKNQINRSYRKRFCGFSREIFCDKV